MPKCCHCSEDVNADEQRCSHCGKSEPTGRPSDKSPAHIMALLVCWGVFFSFLHVLISLPDWLLALIAIPAGIVLFAVACMMP